MTDAQVSGRARHATAAPAKSSAPLPAAEELRGAGGIPAWYELLIVVILSGVTGFGSIAVLLAFFGSYRPATVFPIGAVVTVVLVVLGSVRRRRSAARAPLSVQWPAFGMLVVAFGSMFGNAALDGHYVLVDRDPGVYAVTARWLAQHGSLEISAAPFWRHFAAPVDYSSAGLYPEGNGRLEFQFAHLMPSLMAQGQNIGGDGLMFAVPAILGALALVVLYAVGCRLLRRPWLALVAVTAVGISLPQLVVSRDSYSETVTQLLLWGAVLALLRAWEHRSPRLALFAGFILGATMTSRIDALVYLVLVPVLLAVAWLSVRSTAQAPGGAESQKIGAESREIGAAERRSVLIGIGLVVLGCVPGTVLGYADVRYRAGGYYEALKTQVGQLRTAVLAAAVLSVLLVLVWPRLSRARLWSTLRYWLAVIAPPLVVLGLLLLWVVRPHVYHPTGTDSPATAALQQAAGLPVDGTRTYAEYSLTWLASYLGGPTVALACVGAGALVWAVIRRAHHAGMLALAMTGFGTALYIWSPSISPDQVWASRRFVPAGLPLLAFCAAIAVELLAELVRERLAVRARSRSGSPASVRAARLSIKAPVVIGAIVLLLFPLLTTRPLWRFRTQANFIGLVNQICSTVGPHAAVTFINADASGRVLNQTVHSFCGVPAGSAAADIQPATLASLAGSFKAEGMTLWLMSFTAEGVQALVPRATVRQIGIASSIRDLGSALNKAPTKYADRVVTVYGAKVPA